MVMTPIALQMAMSVVVAMIPLVRAVVTDAILILVIVATLVLIIVLILVVSRIVALVMFIGISRGAAEKGNRNGRNYHFLHSASFARTMRAVL
jgi:hypothetical protein